MPLPAVAETAANQVTRVGREIDRMVADHIVTGKALPSADQFARTIRTPIMMGVRAAILDIDPDATNEQIRRRATVVIDDIVAVYRAARQDAIRRRRRVERATPVDDEERLDLIPLARKAGFVAAVATIAARRRNRGPVDIDTVKKASAVGGQPMPTRLEARLRAEVRTRTAIVRNEHAADVVEDRPGWALYIRDALKGADEPCVRVDKKWATPAWLRNNPVEHPNCTREGRPRELPAGARITLIR